MLSLNQACIVWKHRINLYLLTYRRQNITICVETSNNSGFVNPNKTSYLHYICRIWNCLLSSGTCFVWWPFTWHPFNDIANTNMGQIKGLNSDNMSSLCWIHARSTKPNQRQKKHKETEADSKQNISFHVSCQNRHTHGTFFYFQGLRSSKNPSMRTKKEAQAEWGKYTALFNFDVSTYYIVTNARQTNIKVHGFDSWHVCYLILIPVRMHWLQSYPINRRSHSALACSIVRRLGCQSILKHHVSNQYVLMTL